MMWTLSLLSTPRVCLVTSVTAGGKETAGGEQSPF